MSTEPQLRGNGQLIASAAAVKPQQTELERLAQAIAAQNQLIDALSDKLSSVSNSAPRDDQKAIDSELHLSSLADAVENNNYKLNHIRESLII